MDDKTLEIIRLLFDETKKEIASLRTEASNNQQRVMEKLRLIDTRLSLIEQRLDGIEKWVPVDHDGFKIVETGS